jgi:hypothetical protein
LLDTRGNANFVAAGFAFPPAVDAGPNDTAVAAGVTDAAMGFFGTTLNATDTGFVARGAACGGGGGAFTVGSAGCGRFETCACTRGVRCVPLMIAAATCGLGMRVIAPAPATLRAVATAFAAEFEDLCAAGFASGSRARCVVSAAMASCLVA